MVNPFNIISQFTPLISLSFRLWGNMFAGGLIVSFWLYLTELIFSNIPFVGIINLLGGLTMVPIKMYFDLLSGVIQTLVFVLLTIVYWSLSLPSKKDESNIPVVKNLNLK
jgi:F-type H+-transporting ATPase subunit a